MNYAKPLQWAGIVLAVAALLYLPYHNSRYFGDVTLLGGILLLEVIVASIWKYSQRFLVLVVVAFCWAGMSVPLQGAWGAGRWVVLAAGALCGFIIWTKTPLKPSGSLHLFAFFCICAAFVSATVSPWTQMSAFKALSLALLFLYCASGARLALVGREDRFFRGLMLGTEITTYVTAICYLGLGQSIWGNPNSLGALVSIALFPILLWGWITAEGPGVKFRRLAALLLSIYLIHFSMARAGMVAAFVVTGIFCICLHQYKLLMKVVAIALFLIAVGGMVAPDALQKQIGDMKDAVLYKGHKEEGVLGSRRSPWDKSIATIKERPWFGTGYGTSPTGEDPGSDFGTIRSSAETAREHGSSYITITEWVGLLGVLPFVALIGMTMGNVWKVCAWMNRTRDPRNYAIPIAMVVLSGLIHAGFEDWLFAVGSYLCLVFWIFAFLLSDLMPAPVVVPLQKVVRAPFAPPVPFGTVIPDRRRA